MIKNKILAILLLLFSVSSFGAGYADYKDMINKASAKYGVDPGVMAGLIEQESGFNPGVCSGKNACGLTQIIPSTANDLGVTDPKDPEQSINGGAKYMSQLLKRYNGDYTKALAAYNAGMGNVDKYGGVPPFAETQAYVPGVMAKAKKYGADLDALGWDPSKVDMTKRNNHNIGFLGAISPKFFVDSGIAGGGAGNKGSHFFQQLFYEIDTKFKKPVVEFGSKLSTGISVIGYTLIWLMIMFFLIKVALKQATVDFGDALKTYAMAFIVIVFAFNFPKFMSFLGDDILNFADSIVGVMSTSANAGALLDDFLGSSFNILDEMWTKAGMLSKEELIYLTISPFAFISIIIFGVFAFLAIAMAKIIIFIFIAFAPIFILSLLFESTKNMFMVWVSFLFSSGVVQVAAAMILSVFIAISKNTIAVSNIDSGDVMAFISILLIGTLIFSQLSSLVRGATGSLVATGGSVASGINKGLASKGFKGAQAGAKAAWSGGKTMGLDTTAYAKNLAKTGQWK